MLSKCSAIFCVQALRHVYKCAVTVHLLSVVMQVVIALGLTASTDPALSYHGVHCTLLYCMCM